MNVLPPHVLRLLYQLNTQAAYSVLATLGHAEDFFYTKGTMTRVKDWVKRDDISWLLATETESILFWGGPPTKLTYFHGSLFTLLLDRVYDFLIRNSTEDLLKKLGMLR